MTFSRMLCLSVLSCGIGYCQAVPGTGEASQTPNSFSALIIALDSHQHLIQDLQKADLEIIADKKPTQSFDLHRASEAPLRLAVLLDVSTSTKQSRIFEDELNNSTSLINQLLTHDDDQVAVVTFDTKVNDSGLMTKKQLSGYHISLSFGGGTALYDAIYQVSVEQMATVNGTARKVIIVISDGDDNQSHTNRDRAIALAQASGAMVFSVSTRTEHLPRERGDNILQEIAKQTGGTAYFPSNRKEVDHAFQEIQNRVNGAYVISYLPADYVRDSHFHDLKVRCRTKNVTIEIAKGYYAVK